MAEFNQAYNQRVIYTLSHEIEGSLELKNDPIGWDNDLKEFVSSDVYAGLTAKFSSNLEFVKEGVDFIENIYKKHGKEADIYLNKQILHPTQMRIVNSYDAILNGYSKQRSGRKQDRKLKIDAVESSLITILKSKQSEKIDVMSLTSLNGTSLPPLTRKRFENKGTQLLLISQWEVSESLNPIEKISLSSGAPNEARAVPLSVTASSDDSVETVVNVDCPESGSGYADGNAGNMFYLLNDRTKILNFDIDVSVDYIHPNTVSATTVRLDIVRYTGGSAYTFDSYQTLATNSNSEGTLSYTGKQTITLNADESLALVVHIFSTTNVNLNFTKANMTLTENSVFDTTINDCLYPFEFINRILQIITNRTDTVLSSTYFGRTDLGYDLDGEGAYQMVTYGKWVRDLNEEGITTSWKDVIDSLMITEGVNIGIKTILGKEMIVIEKEDYFYQDKTIIKLPNATKVVKKVNEKYIYSSIEIGYEEGGAEYEESNGLEEPMGRHTYSTPITKIENPLTMLSKIRRDPTGLEFARRKNKNVKDYATTDTQYDDKLWMLDCKKGITDVFIIKKWYDYYATLPTGIYSPETYFNYKYTPKELLLKHKRKITSGIYHYQSSILKCTITVGKKTLATEDITESDDVLISDLGFPYHTDEEIEFNHKVNFEKQLQIEGETMINETIIPNLYGIAEVTDDSGETFYCRIKDIKPNKEGKFKAMTV